MSKLHIVIPMAGAGSRFAKAGYDVPKPFITFAGRMMIEHVLAGLAHPDADYTLVVQRSFHDDHAEKLAALQAHFPVQFVAVDGLTQGAAATALASRHRLDDDKPVLFADSDNIFHPTVIKQFIDDALTRVLDGSLVTFASSDPRFSFIETDDSGYGLRTREKEAISRHAIAGIYYFGASRDFIDCAIDALIYGNRDKGEFYMSGLYNGLIGKGGKVGYYEITDHEWDCVGTPEQLEAYLSKSI